MPFWAGRGSPQIFLAGGEGGKQERGEARQVQPLEEVGRQEHEELTLQDGGEGGDSGVVGAQEGVELELEDMVVAGVEDKFEVGVVDVVEGGVVGEGIARQGEEDNDEGWEMVGNGKRVAPEEEEVGSDGVLGMVQVQVELMAQEEVDNAEVGRDLEEAEVSKLVQEVQLPVGGRE